MSGTFWTIEQVEPIIKERNELRQRVAELETYTQDLQNDVQPLRNQVEGLNSELKDARRRVKELEGDQAVTMNRCECGRGKRPSYDKCLVCAYNQRGERMKALIKYVPFGLRQELLVTWFNETRDT